MGQGSQRPTLGTGVLQDQEVQTFSQYQHTTLQEGCQGDLPVIQ